MMHRCNLQKKMSKSCKSELRKADNHDSGTSDFDHDLGALYHSHSRHDTEASGSGSCAVIPIDSNDNLEHELAVGRMAGY